MKKGEVPEHLKPGIKLMHEPCAPGRRLPGCTAPSDRHFCPSERGMRCMWMDKKQQARLFE